MSEIGKNGEKNSQNQEKTEKSVQNRPDEVTFGDMFRELRRNSIDPQKEGKWLTQERLSELLEVKLGGFPLPKRQIFNWENGHQTIDPRDRHILVGLLSVFLDCEGEVRLTRKGVNEWLVLGGYSALSDDEAAEIGLASEKGRLLSAPSVNVEVSQSVETHQSIHIPPSPQSSLSPRAFLDQIKKILKWDEADEYSRKSWRGMVIHTISVIGGYFKPDQLLNAVFWLMVWAVTILLVKDFVGDLGRASTPPTLMSLFRFLLATLIVPFAIAYLTDADDYEKFDLNNPTQNRLYYRLRLIGATVAYNMIILTILFVGIAIFWIFHRPTPLFVIIPLSAIAVIFGHVGAARIPTDRYRYKNELYLHEADNFFLYTFFIVNMLFIATVYFFYDSFINIPFGGIVLLIAISSVFAIEAYRRDQNQNRTIFFFGVLIPLMIAAILFVSLPPTTFQETLLSILVIAYFWSLCLTATIAFLRRTRLTLILATILQFILITLSLTIALTTPLPLIVNIVSYSTISLIIAYFLSRINEP